MRKLIAAMSIALLLAGCGEDIEIPKMIACDGCKKEVSSAGEACANCSHPISDSIDAYVKAQEEARIRAEEERKLAEIRAEEERKLRSEMVSKYGTDLKPFGGLEVLAKIKEAKESGATKLFLSYNKISDVSPLAGLTNLKVLFLDGNQISDVSPLKGLTNLKELDLYNNKITEEQEAMIKKALPNCNISFR